MRISHLGAAAPQLQKLGSSGKGDDFANTMMDALKQVNETQQESQQLRDKFMANQPVDLDDLMISMEKASTALQLTMQVRNKLLEAFQEINRMQI